MSEEKAAGGRREGDVPSLLVVEDERGLRDMLAYELPERGYRVTCAEDGTEALRLLRLADFDVVVTDLMMPGMSGVEVLREVKKIRPEVEVVMATGFATIETAVESMKLGAYDYIAKPYEIDKLCMTLGRAVERRRLKDKVGELESLNRLKSEFLANMSHELRTPLNAIVGYASLLLDGTYGAVEAEQCEALERVLAGSNDLLMLINGVLDLSKLNAGMMPVYLEDVDAGALAREVVETMTALAVRKGLALTVEVPAEARLRSDRTKVKQILVNLVGNALKFTQKGGVTLSCVRDEASGRTAFSVKDTGPGIPEESIPTIFEEFRQLDGSACREHGGTGLGLAIVKKLADLLGGRIEVSSRVGEGAEFTVAFAAAGAAVRESAARKAAPAILADAGDERPVVLGIDDDPEVLRLLADCLEHSGFRFVGAQSGEEGIALAKRLGPRAITLDVMMPHCDGWTVLQSLQKDAELRAIPVVILSIVENKGLGFSLGATDYIVKPFRKQDLVARLKALPARGGVSGAKEVSRV